MTQVMSRVALYAAVGLELTHYEVDVAAGTLTRRGDVQLPANVQYAWPHASGHLLYAGCSNAATGRGIVGSDHSLVALAIDPASGALSPCGDPVALPTRPLHLTTDIPSEHVPVALTNPSRVQVYRTNPDGSLGGQVHQADEIAAGSYVHQVRIRPNNRTAILTDRGLGAAGGSNPPGCLRLFDYAGGTLTRGVVVAPSGDHGFGPRHLDFHPTQPGLMSCWSRRTGSPSLLSTERPRISCIGNNALADFTSVPTWVQDGEPNWVNQTEGTDQDYDSIGCGMAFLSWLQKLGHALPTIAQEMVKLGNAGTLEELYANVTGDAGTNA